MNWKRGLFRAWLVLSSGWVLLVVGVVVCDLGSLRADLMTNTTDVNFQRIDHNGQKMISMLASSEHIDGYLQTEHYTRDMFREAKRKAPDKTIAGVRFFLTIFTPPIALFLLGLAVLWIRRGFRP